jgi:predicted nucleic acid-binding protein
VSARGAGRAPTDRVFLDANVLFSAAWRADSGLTRLWDDPGRRILVTSGYAVAEAERNLPDADRRARLEGLLARTEVVADPGDASLPADIAVPEKDRPILAAAIAARCTHLLTGDRTHFGPLFGTVENGIRILRPAEYLKRREGV